MSISLIRFVAILVLSAQALPAGLPLLCRQVARAQDDCGQEMAMQHRGQSFNAATTSTSCADSAFCPTNVTAVPALNDAGVVSTAVSRFITQRVADFTPTDPPAPLPPPPQA